MQVTNEERNLSTEQRKGYDVDSLHPIESTSDSFIMQSENNEHPHSSTIGDKVIIDHQTFNDCDECMKKKDNMIKRIKNKTLFTNKDCRHIYARVITFTYINEYLYVFNSKPTKIRLKTPLIRP